MRVVFLSVVVLAVASPLAANWLPIWSPTEVHLVVGETGTARVHVVFSGITGYTNPVYEPFRSSDDQVATAELTVQDHETHTLQIVAVGPGTASIRSGSTPGHLADWQWVHITVVCGPEAPIRPSSTVLRGSIGAPAVLTVDSYNLDRTVFAWYLGRVGDTSHPLPANGPSASIIPDTYGSHYVWVSATTTCSASVAEFRIDVPLVRRRAVTH